MFTRAFWLILILLVFSPPAISGGGTVITFDDVVAGETVFGFDGDNDSIDDAIFATNDPAGFNTAGPGADQLFIDEPGLEGTTTLSPDLRVDFPFGAVNGFSFGFAMNSLQETPNLTVTFEVFDAGDNLLADSTVLADFSDVGGGMLSNFPEAEVSIAFAGTASFATFDFNDADAPRYIIDNFAGTFGSTERPVPAPSVPIPTLSKWAQLTLILTLLLAAGWVLSRIRA